MKFFNWFKSISHSHNDITISRFTFCKDCGSPCSNLKEAYDIAESYKRTERLNELLSKRKLRKGVIRVVSRTDNTRLPDPPGLTQAEENEFQLLMLERK